MNKRLVKKIFRKVRDANLKYHMVENGDTVAVGLSGGKDSLATLHFLFLLKKYTPLEFTLVPILLDLGFENDNQPAIDWCAAHGLPLHVVPTNIGKIVFDIRQESNPCSLCANLRRGALNRTAKELGCNKVALGHHLDDAVATLFMSILYEQRFHMFKPVTWLDRIGLYKIEPLIYVEEHEIQQFIESENIQTVINHCPADGRTKRTEVQQLVDDLRRRHTDFPAKIIASLENIDPGSLWLVPQDTSQIICKNGNPYENR